MSIHPPSPRPALRAIPIAPRIGVVVVVTLLAQACLAVEPATARSPQYPVVSPHTVAAPPTGLPTPVGWRWPTPVRSKGFPPPVRSRLVAVGAPPPWSAGVVFDRPVGDSE